MTLSFGKVSDDLAPCQVEGKQATLIYQDITKPHDLRVVEHVDRGMTWGTVGGNERTVAVENPENDMVCELADFCGRSTAMPLQSSTRICGQMSHWRRSK